MSEDKPLDPELARAAEELAGVCAQGAAQNDVRLVAQMSFTQAAWTQEAFSALVTLLVSLNLISEADLNKLIAQKYRERVERMTGPRLIIPPGAKH